MNRPAAPSHLPTLLRGLSLMDTTMLLVGGVIGSGIFLTAGQIATSLKRPDLFLLVWIAGGVISLLAGFAVAELGGMFPEAGGSYVYLREAWGELPAFLYGWMIFTVIQSGTIGALAVGFSQYFGAAFPVFSDPAPLLAWNIPLGFTVYSFTLTVPKLTSVAAIALLTVINVLGLRRGAVLVNLATWMKFAAMGALILFGLTLGRGDWSHLRQPAAGASTDPAVLLSGFGVALISVLFAYDGWIYITWVAGEVKDSARIVPIALILGISLVAVVYVAMNVVYLYALPLDSIIATDAVVRDAADALFSARLGWWLALMVSLSVFGAIASALLCTARIFYAMALDGVFFRSMARVHPRFRTPHAAVVTLGLWSAFLALIGLYDQLLTYAIFMMIIGYIFIVGALFRLRRTHPQHPRPYRCWGYPWVPAAYLIVTFLWVLNTLWARPLESLGGLSIVLLGIPGFLYWTRRRARAAA
jgi:APA family basic amino acid/polyamine antiporter